MDLVLFEDIYALVCDFIYKVLAIFGIEKDADGNLVDKNAK